MKLTPPDLFSPLTHAPFRRLFVARTLALVGSGLSTIALSLLAFDLVGERAGVVLGSALALKMIAYVTIAPIVGGFADRLPRRALLVGFDLARAALVLAFVIVSNVAEIYLLIFLLNACSAGFTPLYQAAVPELLRSASEYTKGLVLSRVSYDLEHLSHSHDEFAHSHLHSSDEHHEHAHTDAEAAEPHAHLHRHRRREHTHRFVIDAHHEMWPD